MSSRASFLSKSGSGYTETFPPRPNPRHLTSPRPLTAVGTGSAKIVGGETVGDIDEYPWMVSLQVRT